MISFDKPLLLVFYTLLITGCFGTTDFSQEHSRPPVQKTLLDNAFKQTAGQMSCSLHGQLGLGYYMKILIGDTAQLVIMQLHCNPFFSYIKFLLLVWLNDYPL
jgi:hypothetical protein